MTSDELGKLLPPINTRPAQFPALDTTEGSREKQGVLLINNIRLCIGCDGHQTVFSGENCPACKGLGIQKPPSIVFQPDNTAHAFILGHLFLTSSRTQGIRLRDQHEDIFDGLKVIHRVGFAEPMAGWDDDPFDLGRTRT